MRTPTCSNVIRSRSRISPSLMSIMEETSLLFASSRPSASLGWGAVYLPTRCSSSFPPAKSVFNPSAESPNVPLTYIMSPALAPVLLTMISGSTSPKTVTSTKSLSEALILPPINSSSNSLPAASKPSIRPSQKSSPSSFEKPRETRKNLGTPPIAPISLTDTATALLPSCSAEISLLMK